MFGSFGWMELLLILVIVLIIFGAGKIPQLGEGLGKAIKGFKKSVAEAEAVDVTPKAASSSLIRKAPCSCRSLRICPAGDLPSWVSYRMTALLSRRVSLVI